MRFLLQRRDERSGISNPGMLSTFGGRMHSDESPQQALVRELKEELGLVVSMERPLFVGYCEKYDQIKQHVVASWYFGLVLSSDEIVDCREGELELIEHDVSLSHLKNIGPVTLEMISRFASQHHHALQPSLSSQIEAFTLDRSSNSLSCQCFLAMLSTRPRLRDAQVAGPQVAGRSLIY